MIDSILNGLAFAIGLWIVSVPAFVIVTVIVDKFRTPRESNWEKNHAQSERSLALLDKRNRIGQEQADHLARIVEEVQTIRTKLP